MSGPTKGARRLIRQVVQVEILTDGEPLVDDLEAIAYEITEGGSSGVVSTVTVEDVTGPRMAELLRAQGSDPGFLGLDEDGAEIPL